MPSTLFQARLQDSQLGVGQVNSPVTSRVWFRLSLTHIKRQGLMLLTPTRRSPGVSELMVSKAREWGMLGMGVAMCGPSQ